MNVAGVADQFKGWPKIPILHKLQPIKQAVTSSIANLFVTTRYPRAINWCLGSDGTIKRSNTGFLKVNPKTYWASLCAIWHPARDKPPMNGILQCFLVLLQQLSLIWVIFCSVFSCFASLLTAICHCDTLCLTSGFDNFEENRILLHNLQISPLH